MARARQIVAVHNDQEEEEASSEEESDYEDADQDEEEEEGEEEVAEAEPDQDVEADAQGSAGPATGKLKISLGKSKKSFSETATCHVCGKRGHNAGFVGSVYMDCPNKPCYLCKKTGHTTLTCPFRIDPSLNCAVAAPADGCATQQLFRSEQTGRKRKFSIPLGRWQVEAALLKLHSRRITCLEFHPTKDNLVVSGDKKGQVAIWNFEKVYERTNYSNMHGALTNNIRFLHGGDGMGCCSCASDGKLKLFDLETGFDRTLLNLNPGGWIEGVSTEKSWGMLNGLDVCQSSGLAVTGDSFGVVHFVDARAEGEVAKGQLHKKGNKVNSCHMNPVDGNVLLTGSNDWTARIFDIRKLSSSPSADDSPSTSGSGEYSSPEVAVMAHPKVVNSAYFSAQTGRKILSTCIDNRIRIWDYVLSADGPPDREIVHSHDFNRYLTPFRAEWDPKDPSERAFVIGRYISEDCGGVALHPVDIMDAGSGRPLSQLQDPNVTTICPVNKFHPSQDLIVTGSSRNLYAWRAGPPDGEEEAGPRAAQFDGDALGKLLGAANYLCFDADAGDDGEKKQRAPRGKTKTTTTTVTVEAPETKKKKGGNKDKEK